MKPFTLLKILGLSMLLSIEVASANTNLNFSRYLDQVVTQVETSLAGLDSSSSETPQYVIQDMNVDFSSSVSFGINDVLSLSINPEVDLVLVPTQGNSVE